MKEKKTAILQFKLPANLKEKLLLLVKLNESDSLSSYLRQLIRHEASKRLKGQESGD